MAFLQQSKTYLDRSGAHLETWLEPYFTKRAPWQISDKGKLMIVKVAPWLDLILLLLFLPTAILVLTLGSAFSTLVPLGGSQLHFFYYFSVIVLLIQTIIMLIALPGLFKQARQAWQLLFYATLISLIYDLVNWLGDPAAVMGLIWSGLTTVLTLYVLFQIKPHYR